MSVGEIQDISGKRCLVVESGEASILFKLGRDSNLIVDVVDSHLYSLTPLQSIHGVLGLIELQGNTYLVVITQRIQINSDFFKISRVHFYALNSNANDLIDTPELDFDYHYCLDLKKLIEFGNFYYSDNRDITNNTLNAGNLPNEQFIWNSFLIDPLLRWKRTLQQPQQSLIDANNPFTIVIQGAISIYNLPDSPGSSLQLISRLSSKRAGTRFYSRGVDDDGQVANFVETETIFIHNNMTFTYTQIRGSIPLFWEQQGLQAFGQRIQITRPFHASKPAFEKHFYNLLQSYDAIHVLNLLGQKDHEVTLSDAYNTHLESLQSDNLPITYSNLDFHTILRMAGHQAVVHKLDHHLSTGQGHGPTWTLIDNASQQTIIKQHVVFRVNCLDCLDRTNFVQDIFSKSRLKGFLASTESPFTNDEMFWQAHRHLWAENGDALSKLYAGTGALNSSFTRTGKRTLAGLFSDATKSVTRAYVSNVTDKAKQTSIDMFLGNLPSQRAVTIYDPVSEVVQAALNERLEEYSTAHPITIHTGTYNVAGQIPTEDILPWILPDETGDESPELIVLAFQELVQLTPQQIMSTDTFPLQIWERFIVETLRSREGVTDEYIILRSEQIVGLALIVLIKAPLSSRVRNVEGVLKKTGLKGMSGNKGAAAIRLQYESTTLCFIASHMAAGHGAYEERNNDYRTIATGLQFARGRATAPQDHDHVVWMGDFNYRVDLPYESACALAYEGQYEELLRNDQLKRAMRSGIFKGYSEANVTFQPTYRFDFGSSNYDTSEKRRIPAYTDRILFRSAATLQAALTPIAYDSVDLRGSDHRPVYATFTGVVRSVDAQKRDSIALQVQDHAVKSVFKGEEAVEEKLARLGLRGLKTSSSQEDASELPSPSTDKSNWWTDEHGNDLDFVSDVYPEPAKTEASADTEKNSSTQPSVVGLATSTPSGTPKSAPNTPSKAAKARRPPPPPPTRNEGENTKDVEAEVKAVAGNDVDLINLAHSDNEEEEEEEKQDKDKVDVKGGMLEEQGGEDEDEKEGDHSSTERKASVSEMISKIERGGGSDKKEKERVERDLNSTTLEGKEKEKEDAPSTAKKPRPPVPKATKPRVVSHDEDASAAAAAATKDTQTSKDTKDTDNRDDII
ncbi:hypothetical protein E3P99_02323 [Wallemia hederae]|uniref:phosphoinositide 5-phosphatase n=1 Tax=Wallemia hederae TaxID=1540922 RepID=A0A4T0FMC2_9BASI|nr:hypothetical protein E3P99_02323 [Wallemia hederae]